MKLKDVLKNISMYDCFRVSVRTKKERVFESMGTITGIHIISISHLNLDVFEKIKNEVPEYMELEVLEVHSRYDRSCDSRNDCRIVVSDPFGDLSDTPASEILKMNKFF